VRGAWRAAVCILVQRRPVAAERAFFPRFGRRRGLQVGKAVGGAFAKKGFVQGPGRVRVTLCGRSLQPGFFFGSRGGGRVGSLGSSVFPGCAVIRFNLSVSPRRVFRLSSVWHGSRSPVLGGRLPAAGTKDGGVFLEGCLCSWPVRHTHPKAEMGRP